MHNFGAGDLVAVKRESGGEEFLPFTQAIFMRVDFKKGTFIIIPPEIDAPGKDKDE
jgi:ribosomal 30S subunit maturation factor RimM